MLETNLAAETPQFMEAETVTHDPIRDQDKRATQWIVYCGNNLPPDFRRNFPGMHLGGENLGQDFKTLALSKGLLRRCQLTPMTIGYDYLNADAVGEDKSKVGSKGVYDPITFQTTTQYYNECLPGDELAGILRKQQGAGDKGIRVVTALYNTDPPKAIMENGRLTGYTESLAVKVQLEIFPDWNRYLDPNPETRQEFFRSCAELAVYLQERRAVVGDLAREVIGVMLESNAQFQRWAMREVSGLARLVKAPPTAEGKVYTFDDNPVSRDWFTMLGIQEDFLLSKVEAAPAADGISGEDIKALFQQNQQILKQLADNATAQGGLPPVIAEAPGAAPPQNLATFTEKAQEITTLEPPPYAAEPLKDEDES